MVWTQRQLAAPVLPVLLVERHASRDADDGAVYVGRVCMPHSLSTSHSLQLATTM
jgi:hypothetical protein